MKKIILIGLILSGCSAKQTHPSAEFDLGRKPNSTLLDGTASSVTEPGQESATYPQDEGQCSEASGVWREGACYCAFASQKPYEVAIQLVTDGARTSPSNLSRTLSQLGVLSPSIIGHIDQIAKQHNCEKIGHRTFDIAVTNLRAAGDSGNESQLRLIDIVTILQNTLYRDRVLPVAK